MADAIQTQTETQTETITGTVTLTETQSQTQNQATFSLKEQAALALRVPNSGTPWLDMMIMQAQRRDLAMALFQKYCETKLNDTNVAIIKKNGLGAWLKVGGADLSEALVMCEAMAKTSKPPAKPG